MKKQEKLQRLLSAIDDKYCYDLIPGVVGFYHKEPLKVLEKGLKLKKATYDAVGMQKLLKDVQIVYSSMSNRVKQNSDGWITSLWALEQFEIANAVEAKASHEEYINLMDCLVYNMNVGSKAKRMSIYMKDTVLKPDIDGLQYLAASMIRRFAIDCQVNCFTVHEMMKANDTYHHFKQWYIGYRPAIVNGTGDFAASKHNGIPQKYKVARMDPWFLDKPSLHQDLRERKAFKGKLSERQRVNDGVIQLQKAYDGYPDVDVAF